MSGDFLDSNVLLYMFDPVDVRKREVAVQLVEQTLEAGSGWISFQVVQEVLNTVTRKFERFDYEGDPRALLSSVLVPLWRVMPTQALYESGLDLRDRYGYSFYDSMILAAALSSDCDRLYSEDLQAGHRIGDLTIVNPFA